MDLKVKHLTCYYVCNYPNKNNIKFMYAHIYYLSSQLATAVYRRANTVLGA